MVKRTAVNQMEIRLVAARVHFFSANMNEAPIFQIKCMRFIEDVLIWFAFSVVHWPKRILKFY